MSELKQGSYEWFKALSQKDYEDTLRHVEAMSRKVITNRKFETDYERRRAQQALSDGLALLKAAEWNDARYSKKVYKFLFKRIIPFIDMVERTYHTSDVKDEWRVFWLLHHVSRFKKQLEKSHEKKNRQDKFSYVLSSLNVSVTPTLADMKNLFPQVDPILSRIEILQKHAQKLEFSAEEQYFFENVKDNLLPAIFTAADRIKNSPSRVREEAIDNFVQQLGLIEKRMSDMIADAEQRTLADVRNQTAFLVESMERKQIAS